eukprot:724939_1
MITQNKLINNESMAWNGKTVKQWTSISKIPSLQTEPQPNMKPSESVSKKPATAIKWYVVDKNKQRQGPLSATQLLHLYKQHKIDASSLVWNGKSVSTWTAFEQVFELPDKTENIESNKTTPWYAVSRNKKRFGPMSEAELLQKVKQQQLSMDCLAFDGVQVQTWTPIKDIKCLNPEVSQPVPFPNLDASQWYVVSADRTRLGPFDNTQILQKVHNGEILDTTLLCNGVTVTQWTELQNIESLMNALGTTKGNDEGERTKQWYVRDVDKQRQGPLDEHGLLALYDKGKIDDNSLIYEKDRTKEWQKLKRVSFIFNQIQNPNKHTIQSKSDPVAASLVSVILEVDDIAHKHFMNEMIAKRTQIYEQRLHKQQIKQHRERIKSEQMEQDEAVITIKREPKDPHSLHERAAKKARKWRAKLGEMQEVSGRGIKTQDQRKECLDCFQSNTTMNRIERICKAIDEFEPSDYKLLLKVETLIHRYFANNRNLSSKGDRMNINKKTEHLQEEQAQLD